MGRVEDTVTVAVGVDIPRQEQIALMMLLVVEVVVLLVVEDMVEELELCVVLDVLE